MSGVRPGEGARLCWSNVRDNEQSFTIPTAKAGKDIVLPASPEIMAVLRMAREATYKGHHEVKIADLVFPGCAQISAREALASVCGRWNPGAGFLRPPDDVEPGLAESHSI